MILDVSTEDIDGTKDILRMVYVKLLDNEVIS